MRVVAVLWSGTIGGTETFTAALCQTMRQLGADPSVIFLLDGAPLATRLDAEHIPHVSLGLPRGRAIIRHPRALARSVAALGPDGVLLPRGGYLAAVLRAGGYRGRVVSVAHDATLEVARLTARDRLVRPIDRASGFWASDVEVAVSDFVLSHIASQRRSGQLVRIYNGVDLDAYTARSETAPDSPVIIGCAGRLIAGKGVDVLLRAFAAGPARDGARLRLGGDGPARQELERLADELAVAGAIEFNGWSLDMPAFWRECDIAVMPSDRCVESFGMAAIEAMASAVPVVATENGALPELVVDGLTGTIVPRGDVEALTSALLALIRDNQRRRMAGRAARARCEQRFDIRDSAAAYLKLFDPSEPRASL